ncbi:hypothetical protein [Pseudothauera rhizosphaerae]|uniref:Uncharacterized protein n=1 Tax=Pseudothauera rhizosphaerae TaxID=2565932 RepID=A0A4S4AXF0_9RHOO|nr:hypothetical protein [Pseudothauera rhizosphaerae]THF64313.1 hypothetical protein E6O51_03105 [Pseudothauera rhizosphaerae]
MATFSAISPFGAQPTLLAGPNTSNVMGLSASSAPASSGISFGGMALSVTGAVTQAVGAWYSAQSAKSAAKHAATMAKGQMEMNLLAVEQAKLTRSQQVLATEYQMRTQKLSLGYQATIADVNARLSELAARSSLLQGERQEQASRLSTAQMKSSQRVALAANGVDLGSATSLNILTSTDVMGEIDANTIQANAARAAWGYRSQAVDAENQAMLARAAAENIDPEKADLYVSPYAVDPNLIQADMSGYYSQTASAISPVGDALMSLAGSAPAIAEKWRAYQQKRA